jgi:Ca-activated chloride channel homolog
MTFVISKFSRLALFPLAQLLGANLIQAAIVIPYEKIVGPMVIMADEKTGQSLPLAPKFTRYNGIITDGFAQVKVTQTYINDFADVKNMAYVFPLPHDGAVHAMQLRYKNLVFKAVIEPKDVAQKQFDSALANGQQAALLLQNKPNIFEQHIASLKFGDTASVDIEVSFPLKYVDGTFEFTMPTMVADRYGANPATTGNGWNPPANVHGQSLQFNLVLQTGFAIQKIQSPSHPVLNQTFAAGKPILDQRELVVSEALLSSENARIIYLESGDTYPNKDFVLRFERTKAENDFSVASHWSEKDTSGFFAYALYPDWNDSTTPAQNIEVVLLVDISGSQSGWPLDAEKSIARSILGRLKSTDRFSVLSFQNSTQFAFPAEKVVPATATNIQTALTFVNGLVAGGGTELLSAVNTTLAIPQTSEMQRYYVFLTDGFITDEASVIQAIRNHPSHPTIFTFGAGSNLNRSFLETSAGVGNGFATEIMSNEPIEPYVNSAWEKISTPQLTELEVDFGTAQVSQVILPSQQRLYNGLPYWVYGRYAQGGDFNVTLKANRQGQPITFSRQVHFDKEGNISTVIPKLWARTQIARWSLEEGLTEKNKAAIIAVSKQFQVLSEYTAFIALAPTSVPSQDVTPPMATTLLESSLTKPSQWSPISFSKVAGQWKLKLPNGERVLSFTICDAMGRVIVSSSNQKQLNELAWTWDGKNSFGQPIRNGRYFLRVQTSRGHFQVAFTI